jgi:hypothetical protein
MDYKSSSGFNMMLLFGIILVCLKLTENIHLGWLWVLAPFWMPVVISAMLLVLFTWFKD